MLNKHDFPVLDNYVCPILVNPDFPLLDNSVCPLLDTPEYIQGALCPSLFAYLVVRAVVAALVSAAAVTTATADTTATTTKATRTPTMGNARWEKRGGPEGQRLMGTFEGSTR